MACASDPGAVGTSMSDDTQERPINGRLVPVDVQVPCTESEKLLLSQGRTLYVIKVEAFGLPIQLVRRPFEDFQKLYDELLVMTKGLPSQTRLKIGYSLPALPSTSWYGAFDSAKTIEDRRGRLEKFLQGLLLVPEFILDAEDRILRFLKLQRAAIAAARVVATTSLGPWMCALLEYSAADAEGLVPLRHPAVEAALLKTAVEVSNNDELIAGSCAKITCVCGLAERIFMMSLSSATPVVIRAESACVSWAEALLSILCNEASDSLLRDRAGDALLALSRSDLDAWRRALMGLLGGLGSNAAVEKLTSAAANDTDDTSCNGAFASEPADGDQVDGTTNTNFVDGPPRAGGSGRLVAELLLRGLDGEAVRRFIEPSLADVRKRLLNVLFVSSDVFVRWATGLVLARLVSEPGYLEAAKAEAGLRVLCGELSPRADELGNTGLGPLLLEDGLWGWVCSLLASPVAAASGFAMLTVAHEVRPDATRIAATPGLVESLTALLDPAVDADVNTWAATLLSRACTGHLDRTLRDTSVVLSVCSAFHADTEDKAEKSVEKHRQQVEGLATVRDRCDVLSATEALLVASSGDSARLHVKAEDWRNAIVAVDTATVAAECGQATSLAAVEEHQSIWRGAISAAKGLRERVAEACSSEGIARTASNGDGIATSLSIEEKLQRLEPKKKELAALESSFKRRRDDLEKMVQEKMRLTAELFERTEADKLEITRNNSAASVAEETSQKGGVIDDGASAGAGTGTSGSVAGGGGGEATTSSEAAVSGGPAHTQALRDRVDELTRMMQLVSRELPGQQVELEVLRQEVQELTEATSGMLMQHESTLGEWARVAEAHRHATSQLQAFDDCLRKTKVFMTEERSKRHVLREAVQRLMGSLATLDGHLESLESDDCVDSAH
eukprot:TRINITY_DN48957_c0_g1_i1.p1 TRINITY_DN48957_c0_g1~~TRINITY_DN48957_c0_g1_i1.p1  ORF type:complete len:933 (+),score=213.28 TRINITY_DN48957_c0_g1_i1:91-2799(+)